MIEISVKHQQLRVSLSMTSRSLTIKVNSSKLILPSKSLSALIMVLSTNCYNYTSFKLFPTLIFRTVKSSPFDIKPSLFMSYIQNANRSFSSQDEPADNEFRPYTNSKNEILPSLFLSRTAITLLTKGLFANSGISKNSSGSSEPLLSLSNLLKFLYNF